MSQDLSAAGNGPTNPQGALPSTSSENHAELDERVLANNLVKKGLPLGVNVSEGALTTDRPVHLSSLDFTLSGFEDFVEGTDENLGSRNLYRASQIFKDVIDQKRTDMGREGTLYVVMGEIHEVSVHTALQACMIEAYPGVPLALEHPANDLADYMQEVYGCSITDAQRYRLQSHDLKGELYARSVIANNNYSAPVAKNHLLNAVLRGGHPLILMDAFRKSGGFFLDENDKAACETAKKLYKLDLTKNDTPTGLFQDDPNIKGPVIRNHVMARRIIEGDVAAPIVFAKTGHGHLGDKIHGLNFKESLPGALVKHKKPQDRIITLFPSSAGVVYTPENLSPEDSAHPHVTRVIFRGLTERKHFFDASPDQHDFIESLHESFTANGEPVPRALQPYDEINPDAMKTDLQAFLDAHPCPPDS